MIGYAISSSGGPYPLFAISFVFNGIGFGFQASSCDASERAGLTLRTHRSMR
jgi:hypothetical protein